MCCAVVLCQVPWNIGGRCGDRKEFATGKFPITTTVVLDFITGAPEVRTFMKDHSIGPESEADQSSNVPTSRFFRGMESRNPRPSAGLHGKDLPRPVGFQEMPRPPTEPANRGLSLLHRRMTALEPLFIHRLAKHLHDAPREVGRSKPYSCAQKRTADFPAVF
jgi:hypothetical protein